MATIQEIHTAAGECLAHLRYFAEMASTAVEIIREPQWADEMLTGLNMALTGLVSDCEFWITVRDDDLRPFTVATATVSLCGVQSRNNHAAVFRVAAEVVRAIGLATIRQQSNQAVDRLFCGGKVPQLAENSVTPVNVAHVMAALTFLDSADLKGAGERLVVEWDCVASLPQSDPEKRPGASVNSRMIDLMKNPDTHTWSAQEFATRLNCSKSSVAETEAWKTLKTSREMARQKRAASTQERRQRKG